MVATRFFLAPNAFVLYNDMDAEDDVSVSHLLLTTSVRPTRGLGENHDH